MDYETAHTRTNDIRKFYKSIFIFALFAVLIIPDDIFGEKMINAQMYSFLRKTILQSIFYQKKVKLQNSSAEQQEHIIFNLEFDYFLKFN